MAIYLIRHGETAWNAARIVQLPDTPLNERGFDQARRVAQRMASANITRLISSDYQRTLSTAEAIGSAVKADIECEPLLRERHFGDHRGQAMEDIGFDIFAEAHAPPNGETWPQFRERCAAAWEKLQTAAANTRGDLAVVTHGLVLRVLANQLIPRAPTAGGTVSHWANTCVSIVERQPKWWLTRVACAEHLDPAQTLRGGPVGF